MANMCWYWIGQLGRAMHALEGTAGDHLLAFFRSTTATVGLGARLCILLLQMPRMYRFVVFLQAALKMF